MKWIQLPNDSIFLERLKSANWSPFSHPSVTHITHITHLWNSFCNAWGFINVIHSSINFNFKVFRSPTFLLFVQGFQMLFCCSLLLARKFPVINHLPWSWKMIILSLSWSVNLSLQRLQHLSFLASHVLCSYNYLIVEGPLVTRLKLCKL